MLSLGVLRAQLLFQSAIPRRLTIKEERNVVYPWELSIRIPKELKWNVRDFKIKNPVLVTAVSTLETQDLVQTEDDQNGSYSFMLGHDSNLQEFPSSRNITEEVDRREILRRMRISKANKGNVPWNKGRKHSEVTLQRIRERTKIAMQDPKVKLKLMNLGHAQSEETRSKIAVGVRIGWQRRRERLKIQETCCVEWQNLIADASRRGYADEEELQWDTYTVLVDQLHQEWLESIEQRKSSPRPNNKRGPKSPEQRKKISEAIAAKWADPEYRERVCSALSKYHGTPVGGKPKPPRRTRTVDADSVNKRLKKKKKAREVESQNEKNNKFRSKKKFVSFKDPLAESKLEMIKNIRAQRVAMETKKIDAMERAKLLISEAEKAAEALEVAAKVSPVARASLLETRKLIAEATRSIQGIEIGGDSFGKNKNTSSSYPSLENSSSNKEKEFDAGSEMFWPQDHNQANGIYVPSLMNEESTDFDFSELDLQSLLDDDKLMDTSSENDLIDQLKQEDCEIKLNDNKGDITYNGTEEHDVGEEKNVEPDDGKAENVSGTVKKWVCGRLVEVSDT